MANIQEKRRCGKCEKDIRDIEPAQCSCCETFFHVQQECCDANRSSIQQLFSCNKALWLCIKCRKLFANRTLHDFLDEKIRSQPVGNSSKEITDLRTKVDELTELVNALQEQMTANHAAVLTNIEKMQPAKWPLLPNASEIKPNAHNARASRPNRSAKRRRDANGASVDVSESIHNGTSDIDFSDLQLSCPITANAPPSKFWVYLSGFNPRIIDDDVVKIVKRCLSIESDIDVHRLVPKNADFSNYTFVSYKVGLNPEHAELALMPCKWPQCIKVREFVNNAAKNEPLHLGSNQPPIVDEDGNMETFEVVGTPGAHTQA